MSIVPPPQAISVINQLCCELDINIAVESIRAVALQLLDCEKVTLFLVFERRKEIRWGKRGGGGGALSVARHGVGTL